MTPFWKQLSARDPLRAHPLRRGWWVCSRLNDVPGNLLRASYIYIMLLSHVVRCMTMTQKVSSLSRAGHMAWPSIGRALLWWDPAIEVQQVAASHSEKHTALHHTSLGVEPVQGECAMSSFSILREWEERGVTTPIDERVTLRSCNMHHNHHPNWPETIELSSNSSWLLIGSWLLCVQNLPCLVSFWCMRGGLNKEHSISVYEGPNSF